MKRFSVEEKEKTAKRLVWSEAHGEVIQLVTCLRLRLSQTPSAVNGVPSTQGPAIATAVQNDNGSFYRLFRCLVRAYFTYDRNVPLSLIWSEPTWRSVELCRAARYQSWRGQREGWQQHGTRPQLSGSVSLWARGQVLQTDSGPVQLLSAPCLGEQKGCVRLQGTRGDVGKAHPQGHLFWEGFPASIQYFVWIEGVWRHSSSFYCFRNFISIFLRSHQDEGFLIWICNPVVKSDVQTQDYIKGMVQLTMVWCKNLPHQMALTGDDFLWSVAVCFKCFFFEKEPW